MITLAEVSELIRKELRGRLAPDLVLDEGTEIEGLGLSSLQVAEIVFTLEERHEVEFDAARAADVKSIGELIDVGNATIAAESAARAAG
jgi:acyl carrier protein